MSRAVSGWLIGGTVGAKAHAERRYPPKRVKVVDSGVRGR
jgi:hypothetical protein